MNEVPQGATQSKDSPRCEAVSLLICVCDRFTELLQVGYCCTVRAGWELQTGVQVALDLLLKQDYRPVDPHRSGLEFNKDINAKRSHSF